MPLVFQRPPQAAIIDLDGTLVDTLGDFTAALNVMARELALPAVDASTVERFIGKGSEHLIRSVLALDWDADAIEARLPAAMDAYQHHYLDINGQHSTLFPEVIEGLQALKAQGLRLACVTNKPISFTTPLLRQKGLDGFFELVYGGDSLPRKKPDPLPLRTVCSEFGLRPAQVVAIGDSSNDAQAARAAGCPVLTVPYGYNHGEAVHEIDSDGIVTTLLDAANLIRSQN